MTRRKRRAASRKEARRTARYTYLSPHSVAADAEPECAVHHRKLPCTRCPAPEEK